MVKCNKSGLNKIRDSISLSLSSEVYSVDAIKAAAQEFTHNYFISLRRTSHHQIQIIFSPKKNFSMQQRQRDKDVFFSLALFFSNPRYPYVINHFRKTRMLNGVLLTTDFATWIYLSEEEYLKFITGKIAINSDIFRTLEQKGFIATKDNQSSIMQRYKQYFFSSRPELHIIFPTIRCNFACSYCSTMSRQAKNPSFDMDKKTAKEVCDFILKTPSKSIRIDFTGGEPLLNFKIIRYIVNYLKLNGSGLEKEFSFYLGTNGTLVTPPMIAFMKKHNMHVAVSIDGPAEMHDKHRKYLNGNGTYKDSIAAFKKMKDAGINVQVMPTITKYSLRHWKDVTDEVIRAGGSYMRFKYAYCIGCAKENWDSVGFTPEQYLRAWKNTVAYMLSLNRKGIQIREGLASYLLKKIFLSINPRYTDMQVPCGAVTEQFVYDYNGDILGCANLRFLESSRLGHVSTHNHMQILSSKTAQSIVNTTLNLSFICDRCPWYSFCGLCIAQSFSMRNTPMPDVVNDPLHHIHGEMIRYLFERILTSKDEAAILLKWVS